MLDGAIRLIFEVWKMRFLGVVGLVIYIIKYCFRRFYVSLGQKACMVCEKRSFGSSKNAVWFLKEAN